MQRKGFEYRVLADVLLTKEEHAILMQRSSTHYDTYCKSISSPGRGSFLYGWGAHFNDGKAEDVFQATFDQLDTLAKLTEMVLDDEPDAEKAAAMHWEIRRIMRDINDEGRRLNPKDT
jgi:hypothetical protein